MDQLRDYVHANGTISSRELALKGNLAWSGGFNGITTVTQVVLDYLYSTGEFIIHHKNGTRKYYDLAEKYLPIELLNADDSIPDDYLHLQWRFLRRIGAVGLLWDRPSDAWLYIWNLKRDNRKELFNVLLDKGRILAITVEGLKYTLYCSSEDMALIETVCNL